jgi:hypothetical protein
MYARGSPVVGGCPERGRPAGWLPADILWRAAAALVAGSTAKAQR